MAKEKICPMPQMQDCMKEKCAWWDDITGLCAILVIARFGSMGSFYVRRQEQKADMKGAETLIEKINEDAKGAK